MISVLGHLAAELLRELADRLHRPVEVPFVPEEVRQARRSTDREIHLVQPPPGMFGPVRDPLDYEERP